MAGMLASSMRESGPETLMLATTVPVRSKTGPAHVAPGGDQRGEPAEQAVPSRLPGRFQVPDHRQRGREPGGTGPVQAKLLRHLPDADLLPVAGEYVQDRQAVQEESRPVPSSDPSSCT